MFDWVLNRLLVIMLHIYLKSYTLSFSTVLCLHNEMPSVISVVLSKVKLIYMYNLCLSPLVSTQPNSIISPIDMYVDVPLDTFCSM